MATYTLKWRTAYAANGENVLKLMGTIKKTYTSLDKARAYAYAHVKFGGGFYSIGICKDGIFIGEVVFDSQYAWGGDTGIMWVARGKGYESSRVPGLTSKGTLSRTIYRLT